MGGTYIKQPKAIKKIPSSKDKDNNQAISYEDYSNHFGTMNKKYSTDLGAINDSPHEDQY